MTVTWKRSLVAAIVPLVVVALFAGGGRFFTLTYGASDPAISPKSVLPAGEPWAWGDNAESQVGYRANFRETAAVNKVESRFDWIYYPVTNVVSVAAGSDHSLALKKDGTVWAWGYDGQGQLGDGENYFGGKPAVQAMTRVGGALQPLTEVIAIAAGGTASDSQAHSLAVRRDGTVWAWGSNAHGELGDGTNTSSNTAVQVVVQTDIGLQPLTGTMSVAAGGRFSIGLKGDGTVWAWGQNDQGQLGNGANVDTNYAVQVKALVSGTVQSLARASAIAAGYGQAIALVGDSVWAWGDNAYGQLGDGTNTDSNVAVQTKVRTGSTFQPLTGISAVASGYHHGLAVRGADGSVWAWGYGYDGELGTGSTYPTNYAVQTKTLVDGTLQPLTGVSSVAGGGFHSLALKADSSVWAWGWNIYGGLGDGTTTSSYSAIPVQAQRSGGLEPLSGVSAISAGGYHSLAVRAGASGSNPTVTATATPSQLSTSTPNPPATATATSTAFSASTTVATGTSTSTQTATALSTATVAYTATGTATASRTASATATSTATLSQTATATPTPTRSATATGTATRTPTSTATASSTIPASATATWTATATSSQTPGVTQGWIRQFGTSDSDSGNGLTLDESGNLYVVGNTQYDKGDVRKYDPSGSLQWRREFKIINDNFADTRPRGVATHRNGYVYVVGETEDKMEGQQTVYSQAFVRTYDRGGNLVDEFTFGTSDMYDSANVVAVDASGISYVAGNTWRTYYYGFVSTGFVKKYSGSSGWEITIPNGYVQVTGLAVDGSGNVFVSGQIDSQAFLHKYDPSGGELWTRQFKIGYSTIANGVAVDSSGAVYVAGYTSSDYGDNDPQSRDALVRKYDANGSEQWTVQFGTSLEDVARSVAVDASGALYVAGYTYGGLAGSNLGGADIFLRKLDASSGELGIRQFGTSQDDFANDIVVDGSGNIYVAGDTEGDMASANAGGSDVFIAKLFIEDGATPTPTSTVTSTSTATATATPTNTSTALSLIGQIGGSTRAVARQGDYAYVGVGSRMVVLNVADPRRWHQVGQTELLTGMVNAIVVSGTLAYVGEADVSGVGGGLRVVDIADPAHPVGLGFFDSPGVTTYGGYEFGGADVAVSGSYAYVADGGGGLRIVDVHNPANPVEVGSFSLGQGYARNVTVAGRHAYLSTSNGLKIIDVANPISPTMATTYLSQTSVRKVVVVGNYAYVGENYSLRIADISNPSSPVEVGYTSVSEARGLALDGDYAYVASYGGLAIIDVSTPQSPTRRGYYETPGKAYGVAVANGLAYVAAGDFLRIVDVTVPASPTEVTFRSAMATAKAAAMAGSYAYVLDTYGLNVVDLANPYNPLPVGFFGVSGSTHGVAVAGNYAYVANGPKGLLIVDVSSPSRPVETAYWDSPGEAKGVAVAGRYAYVADSDRGLRIVDISDPSSPVEVGFFDTDGTASGVVVSGGYAYVADYNTMRIIDVSRPASPSQAGYTYSGGRGIAVSGSYAYAIDSSSMYVVDISNPTAPTRVSTFASTRSLAGVAISGRYAYLAVGSSSGGLQVVDIAIPAQPTAVVLKSIPDGSATGVMAAGNYAYLTDSVNGLWIFWFGAPEAVPTPVPSATPTQTATPGGPTMTPTPTETSSPTATATPQLSLLGQLAGATKAVATRGNRAYSGIGNRLAIIDITNADSPVALGQSGPVAGEVRGIALSANYAYIAADTAGLRIVDVADEASPVQVGYYDTPGSAYGVVVAAGYAYVADDSAGLRIVDVSNPISPTQVGFYDTPGLARGVALDRGYAFVADGQKGLRVIDVTNPISPTEAGYFDTSGSAQGVVLDGNYAYVADGTALSVIDISNPAAPQEVGFADTPGTAAGIVVAGSYAYISALNLGLRLVDIADPLAPREVGYLDTPGLAYGVAVAGPFAFIADGDAGLRIVDLVSPPNPTEAALYDAPVFGRGIATVDNLPRFAE